MSALYMQALEKKIITKAIRTEVVRVLAHQMLQQTMYPTPEEYTTVCQKLVATYPVLKDTIGNGYVSTFFCTTFHVLNGRRHHASMRLNLSEYNKKSSFCIRRFYLIVYREHGRYSSAKNSKTCVAQEKGYRMLWCCFTVIRQYSWAHIFFFCILILIMIW